MVFILGTWYLYLGVLRYAFGVSVLVNRVTAFKCLYACAWVPHLPLKGLLQRDSLTGGLTHGGLIQGGRGKIIGEAWAQSTHDAGHNACPNSNVFPLMLLVCSVDTPIHINRSHLLASHCASRVLCGLGLDTGGVKAEGQVLGGSMQGDKSEGA